VTPFFAWQRLHTICRLKGVTTFPYSFSSTDFGTSPRIIFKQVDEQTWDIVKYDGERPTDLRHIAKVTNDYFGYERNVKRGFESLTGYDINMDSTFKVVYRLSNPIAG
jgi:hypothetical protein